MLRFRRDRLYIGIEPNRLSLVRLSGSSFGRSSLRVMSSTAIPFADNPSEIVLVEALKRELDAPQWREATCQITLSDRLVRYFVAGRPPGARNIEEVRLAANLRFEDIFAVPAVEWEIRLDMPPFATNQLGCAIRKSFFSNLVASCTSAKLTVASIAPLAVSEFNRSHKLIGNQNGWFTVLGSGSLWSGRKQGNDWLSVHQHVLTEDIPGEFSRLMEQEYLRAALPPQTSTLNVWATGLLGDSASRDRLASHPARLLDAPVWSGEGEQWSKAHRVALSPIWPVCA